ncbi:ABC transporter ATP-binding protein [Schleiferilactobacillus harbinensis]|uniref:ABC transporter ATP-binding protein n=1 Tax=Schleiferilactobacillus harbinensis TaxID=304207 RepID=UPI00345E156B
MDILSVSSLTFSWRKQVVFQNSSFTINQPGLYGLVAPNGAGKTTLLNLISNLLQPQTGEILLYGQSNTTTHVFQNVAFLQDNSVLYPYLSGRDHLNSVADTHSIPRAKIASVIDNLEMSDYLDKHVSKYSLGMKQRLLLAMSLVVKRPLLLLDEPLNGLDPTSLMIVRETLESIKAEGQTALISSHNLDELMRVTQDVFFIVNQDVQFEHLTNGQTAEDRYATLFGVHRL